MKNKYWIYVILPIIAIILELLPYGAVLRMGGPEENGEFVYYVSTYSYFDLTPFGFANFGPLLTAILTGVLLVLGGIYLYKKEDKWLNRLKGFSGVAVFTSLMPLMFGIEFFSVVGALISAVLILEFVFAIYLEKKF